ncbi:hypothetical protein PAXRUDRAFT_163474, partial [Paxillus rubicundulus Ve08.2h10]
DELPVCLCVAPGAPLGPRVYEFTIEQPFRLLSFAQHGIHTGLQVRQLLVNERLPLLPPGPSMQLPLDQQPSALHFTAYNDLCIMHKHPGSIAQAFSTPGEHEEYFLCDHYERPHVDPTGLDFLAWALGQRFCELDHDFSQEVEAGQVRIAGRFHHGFVTHLHDVGKGGVSEGHVANTASQIDG